MLDTAAWGPKKTDDLHLACLEQRGGAKSLGDQGGTGDATLLRVFGAVADRQMQWFTLS